MLKISNGILYHQGKPYLSNDSQQNFFFHRNFIVGGHAGISKTFALINECFCWEGVRKDVAKFVSSCRTCQQTKYIPWPSFGLRQPFPPPSAVSEDFAMDCIIGLPAY